MKNFETRIKELEVATEQTQRKWIMMTLEEDETFEDGLRRYGIENPDSHNFFVRRIISPKPLKRLPDAGAG